MASQAPAAATKYVLVTGCTSTSLGSAIALAFAKLPSFHVFATARSPSSLSHFTPYPNITTLQLDVISVASIAAAVDLVSRCTDGSLDILVNNAGRGHLGPLLDTDLNEFRELLETNVLGVLAVTQAFAPMLIKGKGQVINVGSVMRTFSIVWQATSGSRFAEGSHLKVLGGLVSQMDRHYFHYLHHTVLLISDVSSLTLPALTALPPKGPYSTTKSALYTLTHTLRHELSPLGVSVTHLTIGGTLTRLHSSGSKPLSLGPNSPYKPIESVITRVGSEGELHKVSVPAEKVAAEVVSNAVRRRGPKSEMWLGGLAWVMWLVAVVGLRSLLDWGAARGRGMTELGKVRAREIDGGKVAAD